MTNPPTPAESSTDKPLEARLEQLLNGYWGVSGHNKREKLPMYVGAIKAAFTSLHSMEMEHVLAGIHAKDESGELLKIVRNDLREQIIAEIGEKKCD